MLIYCQLDFSGRTSVILESNKEKIFFQDNVPENVLWNFLSALELFGLWYVNSDIRIKYEAPVALSKLLIKSRVTLCFQFASSSSTTASTATAITFAYQIKAVSAKPYIFGTKKVKVWGNVLDDLSPTLTQGHGCSTGEHKFTCLHY